jgi:acyl carrier protein
MTESDIKAAILDGLAKIAPEADLSTLAPNANVRETLDLDSYDFLQFLIALSETLGVEVPEADYAKLGTLESMTCYLTNAAGKV